MANNKQQQKRTKDVVVVKPILYGNYAQHLGKKAQPTATHKWTCYVRGLNSSEDLSYISKVVFELHESFANPVREIVQPPFEVSEEGWGEFEIKIRVYFQDTTEKPILLTHLLCLYPKSIDPITSAPLIHNTSKPIVEERYEEIIFVNPRHSFHTLLLNTFQSSLDSDQRKVSPYALTVQSIVDNHAPTIDERRDIALLNRTCQALDLKINELNEQLRMGKQ